MIKLLSTEERYKAPMYATNNAYDIKRYLIGRKEDTRLLYDKNIDYWYVAPASEYCHYHFVVEGWRNGLYSDYDFKSEDEVHAGYGSINEFIYMYFYVDKPAQENKTGDYGVHFFYDFGILDSNDILKTTKIKFEDTELYKILEPHLLKIEVEETKKGGK